jgi:antitoxin component YwqK of YwqJK toxin-antitoxin module
VKKLFFVLICFLIIGEISAQDVVLKAGKYYLPDGKLYSGVFKEYGPSNVLVAENVISNGLLDGLSQFYYSGGAKKEQRSYKAGKKDGLWINWNEQGMKTAEARFSDGKKDGYWYIWDEKGTKRYEMFYVNGEKKGKWFIWDENGKVTTEQNYK